MTGFRHLLDVMRAMVEGEGETALGEVGEGKDDDPFRVLIATILSQRTRDENTSKAVAKLFPKYASPLALAEADEATIRDLIRQVGFYRVKAAKIREVSRIILEKFGGTVPDDLDELLSLPSVGRKTANCVLVYGFHKPAIPVDTHVHRISNRLGIVETKNPDDTEQRLRETVSQDLWLDINEYFIRFGKTICKPIGPRCDICDLRGSCRAYSSGIFRKKAGIVRRQP